MSENRFDGEERELAARLAALPRELAPQRDRWPAIAATITAPTLRSAARGWLPAALAAGLALMLVSGGAGVWIGYELGGNAGSLAPTAQPAMEIIERDYALARESYLREIALRGTHLDAATRAALQQNLAIIDRAVHDLHTAMVVDPGNPLYVDSLLMTREREVEMLADISHDTTTHL